MELSMKSGRFSRTAVSVALGTILAKYEVGTSHLVPDSAALWAHKIVDGLPLSDRVAGKLLRHGWFRKIAKKRERRTVPGIVAHYALRKRAIEQAVRSAIEGGCRQLVIVGAGFDSLGPRIAEEKSAKVFELDWPATQKLKRSVVEAAGVEVRYVPVDLEKDGVAAPLLKSDGFDRETPTVFVLEGVLMYLPWSVACQVLTECSTCTKRSVIVGTMMELSPEGNPAFRSCEEQVEQYLVRLGEPFKFGAHPGDVCDMLENIGLKLVDMLEAEDLRERYLNGSDVESAAGEFVFVAEPHANSSE